MIDVRCTILNDGQYHAKTRTFTMISAAMSKMARIKIDVSIREKLAVRREIFKRTRNAISAIVSRFLPATFFSTEIFRDSHSFTKDFVTELNSDSRIGKAVTNDEIALASASEILCLSCKRKYIK